MHRLFKLFGLLLATVLILAAGAIAPAAPPEVRGDKAVLPGIHIDLKKRIVDVDASVCLNAGLLELIATERGGKEHEAIVALDAKAQNIHLALLMIGLKPGSPGRWEYVNKKPHPIDPTGDRVKLSLVFTKDGKQAEYPITRFVRDQNTKKPLDSGVFVFAGSRMVEAEKGKPPVYAAGMDGDVVTLVSFNDELLAAPHAASNSNDLLNYEIDPTILPKVGTRVVLRVRPAGDAVKK